MKLSRWLCAAFLLTFAGAAMEIHGASPVQRLERGIYQEETAGNLAEAIQVYSAIVREEQVERQVAAEALYRLGKCYRKQGNNAKARESFEDLVRRFPDESRYVQAAQQELTTLPAAAASTPSPNAVAEAQQLSTQAWQLWQGRDLVKAESIFRKSLELDATNPHSWNGLGWSLSNQGKCTEATEAFKNSVKLEPRHSGALNGLGWCAYSDGRAEEAISWWQKAVEAAPNATAAWSGLVTVYAEQKQYDKAIEAATAWLKVEPHGQAQSELNRVKALAGAENTSASVSAKPDGTAGTAAGQLVQKVEERMNDLEALVASGNTTWLDKKDISDLYTDWAQSGATPAQKEAEVAALREYLARHAAKPLYSWRLNHLLATAALDQKQPDQAAQYFEAALAAYPATAYPDPSKHSKYQHLVNERAGLILTTQGADAAEKYLAERLASDPKFDYFFGHFWSNVYQHAGTPERYPKLLERIRQAYAERKQKFPEKAPVIDTYLRSL